MSALNIAENRKSMEVSIQPQARQLSIGLSPRTRSLTVEIDKGGAKPVYEGAYNVTPRVTAQTLPTAGKTMERDVTIEKVPYWETGNQSGYTVYIASEV